MRSAAASLAQLRARIAVLEGAPDIGRAGAETIRLGVAAVDAALPWGGLPCGALHEIAPASALPWSDGPALGFAIRLLAATVGRVLWVAERALPYAPALAALGLAAERLVLVAGGRSADLLWVLEEAARSQGLAAILGEVRGMEFTAARRLALAARDSGVAVLLLNRAPEAIRPALTRWRIGGAPAAPALAGPGAGLGARRWRVELAFCRGRGVDEAGSVAAWEVEEDGTSGLRLAAEPGYRHSAAPASRVA